MTASIIAIDAQEAQDLALHYMQSGQPIAFPTDTVYGIGVPALDSEAVLQLYTIKRRPHHVAIPVLLADIADVSLVTQKMPVAAMDLAHRYWPGALTMVVPAADHLPAELLAHGTSVAIRIPNHGWLRNLIRTLGQPLATTSANVHGAPDCTTAISVSEQLGTQLPLILDGGTTLGSVPSTIVDCTGSELKVLRQGKLSIHR